MQRIARMNFTPIKNIPKHFHNLLPFDVANGDDLLVDVEDDDINTVFTADAFIAAVASVVLVVSSNFLFLIKSRFTLILSHKCGHSIVSI